jgi:DNA-binding MarR family transcriptional regulator
MNGVFLNDDRERSSKVVLLSGADVAAAHRLIKVLANPETDVVQIMPCDQSQPVTREALIEAAWHEFERRGRRMQIFSKDLFGEPAWEILLVLYAELDRTRLTFARITDKLDLPASTVLRWLRVLEGKHLVVREPHPTDQRSAFLKLTPDAINMLDMYLSEAIARAP